MLSVCFGTGWISGEVRINRGGVHQSVAADKGWKLDAYTEKSSVFCLLPPKEEDGGP